LRDAVESKRRIGLWPIGYAQIAMVAMALLMVTVGILGFGLRRSNADTALGRDGAA
jgi:hypothetical protein